MDEVRLLKRTIAAAARKGEHMEYEPVPLFELEEIDEDKLWKLYNKDIPGVLRDAFRKLGLTCSLFLNTQDRPGFTYLANCEHGGKPLALGFSIDIDPEIGDAVLVAVYASTKGHWSQVQLAGYKKL